jgi:hypothetical protein
MININNFYFIIYFIYDIYDNYDRYYRWKNGIFLKKKVLILFV